ncbi:MAG: acyltransferase [Planctomycetota bacterium]|jgi:lipopolysaccharide O-acetyltransferase
MVNFELNNSEVNLGGQDVSEVHISNRARDVQPKLAEAIGRYRHRVRRGWKLARTRLLWGWRLHALGRGSCLARKLRVNNPRAVAIGSNVIVESHFVLADLRIGHGDLPKIVIGDGCTILYRFQCNAEQSVRIGRNVLIASNVLITDSDHVVEPGSVPVTRNQKLTTRPVCVEDNCWLGQNVVVLKGVTIGHDSIVGANTVVTHDVPPCSVVAGNPGQVIKKLRSDK